MGRYLGILFALFVLIGPIDGTSGAFAQEAVKITAVGEKKYTEYSSYIEESAVEDAKRQAIKKVAASFPKSKKRMFKDLEESIYENIDDFVIESAVQQKKNDAGTKTFKVAISALVDVDALNAFFIDNSEAGNQEAGDASDFGAIFVARQETSRKAFKVKQTDVTKSESQSTLAEESASDGTTSLDSTNTKTMDVNQSGGSSESKRDAVEYQASLELSEELAFAVEEQLVEAGFEPMDAEDLDVPYLEDIVDQGLLRKNGSFPKKLIKQYKNAAIDEGWTFLGLGSVDVGTPKRDAVRGTIKVPAKVSFKVWMLSDGRAKTVASVRPKVVYGDDLSDAGVAEVNAYNEAVVFAMDTVVSQLQQKGLR
jgi:hypothetical protein